MAFVLPTFNLQADVYTWVAFGRPTVVRFTTDCQLRAPDMRGVGAYAPAPAGGVAMVLLVPPLTDIRDHWTAPGTHGDMIECPPGSGRVYYAMYCDDVAKGFPNEHRFVVMRKYDLQWPSPIP